MNANDSLTRRTIIKAGIAFTVCNAVPFSSYGYAKTEKSRSLHFHNIHTGESLKTVYWEQGVYISEAMKDISYILRDHRTDDMKDIDPRLLDVISLLHRNLDSRKPFEVISGYRTARSNEFLYEHSNGVNPNSLHMYGKAIDIRLDDCHLKAVRNMAIAMQKGGVGYYPSSDFVHIDTGPVKHW